MFKFCICHVRNNYSEAAILQNTKKYKINENIILWYENRYTVVVLNNSDKYTVYTVL